MDGGNWQTQQRGGVLIGKVKTMAQMMSLVGLLWRPDRSVEYVAIGLLYIAAVLTFWSMFQYLNAARNDLLEP